MYYSRELANRKNFKTQLKIEKLNPQKISMFWFGFDPKPQNKIEWEFNFFSFQTMSMFDH